MVMCLSTSMYQQLNLPHKFYKQTTFGMKKRGQDALVLSAPEYLDCWSYLTCGLIFVSHLKSITANQVQFFSLGHLKKIHKGHVIFILPQYKQRLNLSRASI